MDDLTPKYQALLERIARYPVTDPAEWAAILAEIERQYPAALEAELADRAAESISAQRSQRGQ